MKLNIVDERAYSQFKIKAYLFVTKNKWQRIKNVKIGDYIIVTDPSQSIYFLNCMKVTGFSRRGGVVVAGDQPRSAFNIAYLDMSQCERYYVNVHTKHWKEMIKKLTD